MGLTRWSRVQPRSQQALQDGTCQPLSTQSLYRAERLSELGQQSAMNWSAVKNNTFAAYGNKQLCCLLAPHAAFFVPAGV